MYEQSSNECQGRDKDKKKVLATKITKDLFVHFVLLVAKKLCVGLKLFETFDADPTATELDDAATFKIV